MHDDEIGTKRFNKLNHETYFYCLDVFLLGVSFPNTLSYLWCLYFVNKYSNEYFTPHLTSIWSLNILRRSSCGHVTKVVGTAPGRDINYGLIFSTTTTFSMFQ